eukprot:CAMPEP_0176306782 /NCGR_PEP_ID=MMETSP0121_2-20121125/63677_1 /TAXON_ID=160619 /ORGANISM="Kryptoperidinium foliaceum, Strain CCMP 1326" /LENGTH=34 /DNA_ID= /DNA_START= /DNA_END= /DNA_ORIENTATION=
MPRHEALQSIHSDIATLQWSSLPDRGQPTTWRVA